MNLYKYQTNKSEKEIELEIDLSSYENLTLENQNNLFDFKTNPDKNIRSTDQMKAVQYHTSLEIKDNKPKSNLISISRKKDTIEEEDTNYLKISNNSKTKKKKISNLIKKSRLKN